MASQLKKNRLVRHLYAQSFSRLPFFGRRFHHIEVETISLCNRKCSYCPNVTYSRSHGNDSVLMDTLYNKVFDDLASCNFTGTFSPHLYGEPLLDPRLPDIIRRASSINAKPKLYTNGDYLTPDLIDLLISHGLKILFISQHSKSLSKGLKNTLSHLFKLDPLISPNKFELNLLNCYNGGLMINDLLVKVVDFHSMSLSTSLEGSHGDKLGNRGGFFNWDQSIKPPVACKYITFPVIDVSGRMPLCSTDYASEYLQGNISSSSIYDIWTDPNNIRLRKRIFRSQMDLEICKSCTMGT